MGQGRAQAVGTRALEPRVDGYERSGRRCETLLRVVRSPSAERTIVFLPTWSIVHSRIWKAQIPYFARHGFRVLVFDGRGNGRSGTDEWLSNQRLCRQHAVRPRCGGRQKGCARRDFGWRQVGNPVRSRASRARIGPRAYWPQCTIVGSQLRDLQTFLSEPVDRDGWSKYNAVY